MTLINVNDQVVYDTDLPKALVLFRYDSTEEEELSLVEGAYIDILNEADDGWWRGLTTTVNRQEGIFPFNYVRRVTNEEFNIYIERVKNNNNNHQDSNNNIDQANGDESSNESTQHQHSNNQDNQSHKLETHIIASLSDPLEQKRTSSSTSSSFITNESSNSSPSTSSFFQPSPTSQNGSTSSDSSTITIKINDIAKEGYLVKRGHIRKNWKVRWFQLKRNRLTYSKSPKETKINELLLTPDTEIDIATSMKRINCFQIKIPIDKSKDKYLIFYCSAQSTDELESWIHALNQCKTIH